MCTCQFDCGHLGPIPPNDPQARVYKEDKPDPEIAAEWLPGYQIGRQSFGRGGTQNFKCDPATGTHNTYYVAIGRRPKPGDQVATVFCCMCTDKDFGDKLKKCIVTPPHR
jgi:hypothetical protein